MPISQTQGRGPTTDVAGPSHWQREHILPGALNGQLQLRLTRDDKPILPLFDSHVLLEPHVPFDLKGKSPVRCIRGNHRSQFSLHPAREGHVRLAIREPGIPTRSVYFKIAGAGATEASLQGLDEAGFDREIPSLSYVGHLGYQPIGADIIDQVSTVPSYTAQRAWQRLRECPPFFHAPIPDYRDLYLHTAYDSVPNIKGQNKEKLVAAIYTSADAVFLTQVHAPLWKKVTTSSRDRLRAYVAPAGGPCQGPYQLDVSYSAGTKRMQILGLVQLRDGQVREPYITHRFAQYCIHGKKAEWITD